MKRTIQHWFSLFLLMVLASIGSVSAQTLSIADFDIEAGGTAKVTIDLDQAGKVLLAFQADIVLPEGLTVKGKPKAVTGTMTDEFEEETEPTVTFANNRIVVYSGDGYAFNADATSIVTLTLEAAANFVSGEIKLTNITISAEGNVRMDLADAVTNVNGGGTTPVTYGITIATAANGTVTADKTEAEAGEKVTLTVTPAEGYELETITVIGATGAAVALAADNTFVMPAGDVIVTATFKKKTVIPTGTPKLSITDFSIDAGGTATVSIDLDQAGNQLLAFQADIVLPDGLTIQGKPKAVVGTMTDEFGDEAEPTVTYSNGRIVVYNGDGLMFNADATSIVTLKLVAADNFAGGVIKLENITISAEGNVKIEPADAVTQVSSNYVAPTTYNILVQTSANGNVIANKEKAEAGETVSLSVRPVDGYELEAINVTDANGVVVALSADFTFVMPAAAVIITASFKKTEVTPVGTPRIYITDFSIDAGATKEVTIDLDQAGNKLLAFQADIVLPDGLTIQGKPKAVVGTMTDEFGDEAEPTVTYSNGRIVVYNGDGLMFNADATSIVTLKLVAADNFAGGVIKLENITISAEGNVKIEPADAVTQVSSNYVAPTTYNILVQTSANGNVIANKEKAEAGETVSLSVRPVDGYELEAINVTDANGVVVALSADFTFVMPAAAVIITASFKKTEVTPVGTPKIYITDFSIDAGATKEVTIDLDQAGNKLLAFQTDIVLPEGLTIQGKPKAVTGTMTDEFGDEAEPTVTYSNRRIVVYNGDGLMFNADATSIVILKLVAADNFAGGVIKLENITISAEGNVKIEPADAVTQVTSNYVPPTSSPKLSIADFSIDAGSTKQVTIDLDQAGNRLLAFQTDIVLPAGLTIQGKPKAVAGTMTDEYGDEAEPTVTYSDGRIVVYNGDGLMFNEDATSIVILTLKAADNFLGGEIKLVNTIISAAGNVKLDIADYVTTVNSSYVAPTTYAINIISTENGSVRASKAEATAGEVVYLTVLPSESYDLDYLIAATADAEVTISTDFSFVMPAAEVTIYATFKERTYAHDFDYQEYLLYNVGAGLYLGAGNNWGTQASLLEHAEYVRLEPQDGDNVYYLETQVNNGGAQYFLGTNGYMDSNAAPFTFQKLRNGNYTIISPEGGFIGYDGSTILSMYLEEADVNAQWTIIKLADAKAALSAATETQPMDATFLINDPNFGRNNRNKGFWNMDAINQNLGGGDAENYCAESWHSDFILSQVLTDIPNGLYALTAQGFYRQDGDNETNLPVFYANEATATFPVLTGMENSMSDASNSFSQGLYTIEPIYVYVDGGELAIGAKLEGNTTLWCVWDNFTLTYFGPDAEPVIPIVKPGLAMADFDINVGGTKQVTIDLIPGSVAVQAFQADIEMPYGLSIQGKPKAVEGTLEDGGTPVVTYSNGRIVVYNSDGLLFNADAKDIVTLNVVASDDFQGGEIILKNIIISGEGSLKIEIPNVVVQVTSNNEEIYIYDELAWDIEGPTDLYYLELGMSDLQYGALTTSGDQQLSMNTFSFYADPNIEWERRGNNDRNSAALVNNVPMSADQVNSSLWIDDNKWTFLSFPYDVRISDIMEIEPNTEWVVRKYDGAERAAGNMNNTWVDMNADDVLHAYEGYIWQSRRSGWDHSGFKVPAINNTNKNNIFASEDVAISLKEYASEFSHNRSWNMVGNPYPAYYDIRYMDFTAPIITWNVNNQSYEAYSPMDDSYILYPYEAFFVQRPEDGSAITFGKQGRQVSLEQRATMYNVPARVREENAFQRSVLNLTLSNDKYSDRTRVVLNENASSLYEQDKDASKFLSDHALNSQLFTIESGVQYAINERPLNDGLVLLGVSIVEAGKHTMTLQTTADIKVILTDLETGESVRLDNTEGYTFEAETGMITNRFQLHISKPTGINSLQQQLSDSDIFTIDGRRVQNMNASGIYIVRKGAEVVKVRVK